MNHTAQVVQFTAGVPVEDAARDQIRLLAHMPFVKHIAVMPDVHSGKGSTVGTVFASEGAVIPAAVGADLGCGMAAFITDLHVDEIKGQLPAIRSSIEAYVPHGRTDNGGENDKGRWPFPRIAPYAEECWGGYLGYDYGKLVAKYPSLDRNAHPLDHLGTLGTGNHFIEVSGDEDGKVWVVIHSGSRGIGARIGALFMEIAKERMKTWHIQLPDPDLAYLPEGTEDFDDYMLAVQWAQKYAMYNRVTMMRLVVGGALRDLGLLTEDYVNGMWNAMIDCHHNFVAREHHLGKNLWITRKGAVRARTTDLAIIPGSMGAKSFVIAGKGNAASLTSCSHGAGRIMSRTKAKSTFTLEDHEKATAGIECRKDAEVLDETPGAYKNIAAVMNAQKDLVTIKHTLKQLVCVKG